MANATGADLLRKKLMKYVMKEFTNKEEPEPVAEAGVAVKVPQPQVKVKVHRTADMVLDKVDLVFDELENRYLSEQGPMCGVWNHFYGLARAMKRLDNIPHYCEIVMLTRDAMAVCAVTTRLHIFTYDMYPSSNVSHEAKAVTNALCEKLMVIKPLKNPKEISFLSAVSGSDVVTKLAEEGLKVLRDWQQSLTPIVVRCYFVLKRAIDEYDVCLFRKLGVGDFDTENSPDHFFMALGAFIHVVKVLNEVISEELASALEYDKFAHFLSKFHACVQTMNDALSEYSDYAEL